MSITKSKFGVTLSGDTISIYEIKNENGIKALVSEYGAILVSLIVPDKNGIMKDVVLGYDDVKSYFTNDMHFGSTIG